MLENKLPFNFMVAFAPLLRGDRPPGTVSQLPALYIPNTEVELKNEDHGLLIGHKTSLLEPGGGKLQAATPMLHRQGTLCRLRSPEGRFIKDGKFPGL